ncbi:cytochrome c oxidase subunit 4 [Streptantibioticus ferralitis]|uniref:cytochrome-c oxidase n=1 Tax=Streptantibioticus ferralitis TaxID=236510 RepID=A0ABT5Z8L0_9ACTN|nr:cytochrome c oxidase subunit 4 [Streptantibioticus ferralitis]MDF2260053.1 cytochrome c oxidase subunit 4 [Streptantibioticus ferralitis]
MKVEAYLFTGVSLFFFVTDIIYAWLSGDPTGTAVLTVAFIMAALIAFFCAMNQRRKGTRPEDRRDGDVRDRAGLLDFFPPQSAYPPLTALGFALGALGVVFGLWLFLLGIGILATGILGFAFEFLDRG